MIRIKAPVSSLNGVVALPLSKSETNRALIFEALSNGACTPTEVSDANDSVLLRQLLANPASRMDCQDAGTCFRFLTAYFSIIEGEWTLTGSERMLERPIGPLVDGLRTLGADIDYLGKEGYPPLRIRGKRLRGGAINLSAYLSSQFISAICMIAPFLEGGLKINLKGPTASEGYIALTLQMMELAGIPIEQNENFYHILPGNYKGQIPIGADFSAASYWYETLALSPHGGNILLKGLNEKSHQPDRVVMALFEPFGVCSAFTEEGLSISKNPNDPIQLPEKLEFNFIGQPDLAQTMVCTCAGLGIKSSFGGLRTLRIKETDRVIALVSELNKMGAGLVMNGEGLKVSGRALRWQNKSLHSLGDHRMAMALAPLVCITGILDIEQPEVVTKSFPGFWKEFGQFFEVIDIK
ncbi:MAG: 3-phosphoshikimate 1-carboxyvinyltransferase [Saprospiraceae bacterium]|nr:3-phosphoshikimate 1-carboxyvinyltransferase [Saprospiraceae bacterium]